MPALIEGVWCPKCKIGWPARTFTSPCSDPPNHIGLWVESDRPADQPAHSVTADDRRGSNGTS